jgi:hypothetical protein
MEAGRLNAYKAAPDAMRAVQQVEAYTSSAAWRRA